MKMTTYFCDKCQKLVKNNDSVKQVNGLDFCPNCYGKLVDVIQAWIDEPEEKEVKRD